MPGEYSFTVSAVDGVGVSYGDQQVTITVIPPNAPPIADPNGPYLGDEGSAISIDGSGSSDPDGDALTYAWSYTAGAGVDAGASCTFGDATAASTTITCTDDGTYNLTLTVDDGQATDTDTATVDVANVAPDVGDITIEVNGNPETAPVIPVGTTIDASASFTDPGTNDTHTASWDWGDGTTAGTVTQGAGSGSVADNHTYNTPGTYTIELTVTDDDGGVGTSTFRFVVVYDPDGGFVTGGGWIDSPAGAYVPDSNLAGRANFGFVSKYQKGKTTPTGQTEFQFKAGDLNFHSDSYEWLVIAHHKAQYEGTGTINGDGYYGFMLFAVDAKLTNSTDVDLFRIKIWDISNGDAVVYDNQLGEEEDADPTTQISGGSIVIHTKGK
jgi:PKD repeat protein